VTCHTQITGELRWLKMIEDAEKNITTLVTHGD
jgi:hypothetical protein